MGLINDLKQLLFGTKSVAKSAMNSAETPVNPVAEPPATDEVAALFESEPVASPVAEETETQLDFGLLDSEQGVEEAPSRPVAEREPGLIEQLGERILNKGAEAGHSLLDKGEAATEKLGELSEKVGKQVLEKGGDLLEKVQKSANELLDKAQADAEKAQAASTKSPESILAKAKAMGDKIEALAQDKNRDFTDSLSENKGSKLDEMDDFFQKAQRFAEGDYGKEGAVKLSKSQDTAPEKQGRTHGFSDHDGDGDDLFDDAIIDED